MGVAERIAFTLGLGIGFACSPRVVTAPEGRHAPGAFTEVPYPPPAALVEVVPRARPRGAVWVDGYWTWRGSHYVWQRGGWVLPPPESTFAPWRTKYTKQGQLLFAPGRWYGPDAQEIDPPDVVVPARTPPNQRTVETESAR